MKRLLLGSILLVVPVCMTGCLAAEDQAVMRPLDVADVPQGFQRVRILEEKGLKQLRTGNTLRNERRRREYMDSAMGYFREARDLFVEELINDPGSPDERFYLEREIERLGDLIEHVHRLRPLGS